MARKLNQLKDVVVRGLTIPGSYCDGGGLELQISPTGARTWVMRFMLKGKRRQMGLGGYPAVTIKDAREKAADARKLLVGGVDPLEQRVVSRASAEVSRKLEEARQRTFDECAEIYITAQSAGWKNPKLAGLWRSTLKTYASPVFGDLPVGEIDTGLVLQVLEPIWTTKTETAKRVRMRIENILSWAKVRGYRSGENPAVWQGHLDQTLAPASKVTKVKHHPALPYEEIGAFMVDLRGRDALAARALELVILTGCRTSEVLEATWSEIDLEAAAWVIPAERMKMDKVHRVPLSEPAVALLKEVAKTSKGSAVFPGQKGNDYLSNMSMLVLLRRMKRSDLTVHGFRSTFRDWAAETTSYPNHVVEMALAHAIGNEAEAAYRRGDLFEKRQSLMRDWATFCFKI